VQIALLDPHEVVGLAGRHLSDGRFWWPFCGFEIVEFFKIQQKQMLTS
jgi:hypothetical protein